MKIDELRDAFAAAALTGLLANKGIEAFIGTNANGDHMVARLAYAFANAMMRARKEKRG